MAENGGMASTVRSIRLDMEPACIGFCPEAPEYFVIGTWHLIEEKPDLSSHTDDAPQEAAIKKQKHEGSIDVYRLTRDEITKIQTEAHPTCAIWDLEFQPHAGRRDLFAAGTSAGTVLIYRVPGALEFSPDSRPLLKQLSRIGPYVSDDDEIMITKCCWHPTVRDMLAFSTLAGDVHLARLGATDDGGFAVAATMTRTSVLYHTELAWTVALAPKLTVYSGGDDAALRYVACTPPPDGDDEGGSDPFVSVCEAVAMQRGPHEAGVVSILPLPDVALETGHNVVVTGSYDDKVRVLAVRPPDADVATQQYRVLAEAHVGGGAWRLRLVSVAVSRGEGAKVWRIRLLAPCMSAGSRVLEIRGSAGGDGLGGQQWEVEVLGSWFEDGEGDGMLNYGADFQPGTASGDDRPLTCVSTSFYSKMLYLWRFGST
ncbi:hypothetical protein MAPG_03597 [Magnaporthiopsis poae ATCC 64411]|uniref:Uncharacterized protein n=1 Tax=Magnaporthiopsis poae (strain ATCC 64411 / 73-15) TaxID=644358 RepID=A0A0C4DUF7_MAGP6|nr:hypothetical protein MAPG_03597 [Magnaporthiopsis poae ATCC 64411]